MINNKLVQMYRFVSIILPVRNESNFIIPCLQSIAAQDMPLGNIELLLIDGRSVDNTISSINSYLKNSPKAKELRRWEILDNPNQTAPCAMNLGIRAARGDIILRFDGHSIMEPDYVSNCVKYLEQTKADNVGGPMRAVGISNTGRAIALAHQSPFGLGGGAFHTDFEGFADTAYLGCFPRETFAKYGLYDTRLTRNQDIELNARIRKGLRLFPYSEAEKLGKREDEKMRRSESREAGERDTSLLSSDLRNVTPESGMTTGREESKKEKNFVPLCLGGEKPEPGKIYLTPAIRSYYRCRETLSGLWSQNFKNGQWVVYTKYIAPYALSLRHFIPLVFVGSLLLLAVLVTISATQGLISLKSLTEPALSMADIISGRKGSTGLNILNRSNVLNNIGHIALLLLVVELGAYFGAMLYFISQAWRSVQRKAYSGKALSEKRKAKSGKNDQFKAGIDSSACGAGSQAQNDMNNLVSLCLGGKKATPGSLLLLPIVFLTLHFSYGLGSLWGLITLAGWAKRQNNV